MSAFLWRILNVSLAIAAKGINRFLAHALAGRPLACYGDLCFKQRVVIECLVTEKELVTKI
jgi:hypothetical protein